MGSVMAETRYAMVIYPFLPGPPITAICASFAEAKALASLSFPEVGDLDNYVAETDIHLADGRSIRIVQGH